MAKANVEKVLRSWGVGLLLVAGVVFVVSWVVCVVVQGFSLTPNFLVLVAYFGGPLPIIPGALGLIGMMLLGLSSLMRRVSAYLQCGSRCDPVQKKTIEPTAEE